jgi:peptidoglycan/LPS O-acetylase OafA/YrhL
MRGSSRVPALDGLRALAALSVVAVHGMLFALPRSAGHEHRALDSTYEVWSLGRVGVHLFFVLSGYLLFRPYAAAIWRGAAWPSTRRFFVHRVRRIGPAYWTALAILAVVTGASAGDVALHAVFLHNATPETFRSINDVFWSMAVEVQFYLALPGLALVIRRIPRLSWVAFMGASAATQVAIHLTGWESQLAAPAYLSVFAAGMAVAALRDLYVSAWVPAFGVALLLLALAASVYGFGGSAYTLLWDTALGVGFASILWCALHLPWFGKALSVRPLRFVGLISYSIFIWHVPLNGWLLEPALGSLPGPVVAWWSLFVVVGVIPLSWVSYRLTERPFHAGPASTGRGDRADELATGGALPVPSSRDRSPT